MSYIKTTSAVTTTLVSSQDGSRTYSITKTLENAEGERAVMVLMYPTRSAENIASDDTTLNHLVSHMGDMSLKELTVINLFSKVVKTKLSAKGLLVDEDNLKYIEDEIMSQKGFKDTKFIAAWGSSMDSCKACQDMKERLVKMYYKYVPKGTIYQLATKNMPDENCPHPLWFGIRCKYEHWYLTECRHLPEIKAEKKEAKKPKGREFVVLNSD